MDHFCSLFSGSTGNSTYIGDENSGILIDAGKSYSAVIKRLSDLGCKNTQIKAIFITHTHSDHISALECLKKKQPQIPIYGSLETVAFLNDRYCFDNLHPVHGKGCESDRFFVTPFNVPHDCDGTKGYTVALENGLKLGICTDLGEVTPEIERALSGCRSVLVESNHDVNALKAGSYPFYLKQRILGRLGHLSNTACGELAARLVKTGTKNFILGHLSAENNMPDIAFETVNYYLENCGAQENGDYFLRVASPEFADRHFCAVY